ncbi:unnamed protein product, partial [Arabidopsis halleri]
LDLSGCGISQFPNLLKSLHNLEIIDVSNNNIRGKVPENLPRLSIVSLSNNSFTSFEGSREVLENSSHGTIASLETYLLQPATEDLLPFLIYPTTT